MLASVEPAAASIDPAAQAAETSCCINRQAARRNKPAARYKDQLTARDHLIEINDQAIAAR